jgi:hypothetical protein|tara:strand:- start:498 stop:650 length:153 start_codon:yes stop_codon:yes gene_type:complete
MKSENIMMILERNVFCETSKYGKTIYSKNYIVKIVLLKAFFCVKTIKDYL